jgi:hypothetical protein
MINDARCDCGDPCILNSDLDEAEARIERLEIALKRIRDNKWVQLGGPPEWLSEIAKEALE